MLQKTKPEFLGSPWRFATFSRAALCVWVLSLFVSESEAQWRSVQVAWLQSPAGVFCSLSPRLHRCLLAHVSCHMFPARPSPEGAKSVFTHNLHSLTRPAIPLTGAHGVAFMKHSSFYPDVFFPVPSLLSTNCCVTSLSISALFPYCYVLEFKVRMKRDMDVQNTYVRGM